MIPTSIQGATHRYSAPANWNEKDFGPCAVLEVRRQTLGTGLNAVIECYSAWKPSAEELAVLNAGGSVEIGLVMPQQCAMRVGVVGLVLEPIDPVGYDEHGPATP